MSDGSNTPISWRSTAPDIVSIDPSGRASALRAGTSYLVAEAPGGAARDSVAVSIGAAPVVTGGGGGTEGRGAASSVSLTIVPPLSPALRVGESLVLRARVRDGQSTGGGAPAINWSTSDARVASVDAGTGRVVARAPGTVTVVAQIGAARSTIDLTVGAPTVASIELIGNTAGMKVGDTVQMSAVVRDDRQNALNEAVSWSSRRPEVARVDASSGMLIARSAGTTVITASAGGLVQEKTISVQGRVTSNTGGGGGYGGGAGGGGTTRKTSAELEAEVHSRIATYFAAVGSRDTAQIRKVFPAVPDRVVRDWQNTFKDARDLTFTVESVQPMDALSDAIGTTVRVRVQQRLRFVYAPKRQNFDLPSTAMYTMQYDGAAWKIIAIQ
jgi:uncharacterized protein YjdB